MIVNQPERLRRCRARRTLVLLFVISAPAFAQAASETTATSHAAVPQGHAAAGSTHPINWVSCNRQSAANPPMIFPLVNFALLVGLLIKFTRKPLVGFLRDRHDRVMRDLTHAREIHSRAKRQFEQIDGKLRRLDEEIQAIKDRVATDALAEKERIIADAQAEAERLTRSAEKSIRQEIERARRKLGIEAIEAALAAAEKLLKEGITADDRERLTDEYLQRVASSGGRN